MGYLSNTQGDPNNLGYFADPASLISAYPVGVPGAFAIVGSTDSVWVWDDGTVAWVDTSSGGVGGDLKSDGTVAMAANFNLADNNLINVGSTDFDTDAAAPAHQEGRVFYDPANKSLSVYDDETESLLQVGQEEKIRVYNPTGSTITNGSALTVTGVSGGVVEVGLAIANDKDSALNTIGIATHDIETLTQGWATTSGTVNDLNTTTLNEGGALTGGAAIYLSDTVPGQYTETRPKSPSYEVRMGGVIEASATTGKIYAEIRIINNIQDVPEYFDGSTVDLSTFNVTSNGTVITASWEKTGGGDIAVVFNGIPQDINTTPAQTVTLTAGSDISPTENFVFVPESTRVLTANTTGFPEAKYAPVGRVFCQSAASMQTDGPYKVHAYSDHLYGSNNNGHASHINAWIRQQPATWQSGVGMTATGGASALDFSTSSGVILQLHEHAYPAFDTTATSDMYVVNSDTALYNKVTNLFDETNDANGVALQPWYTVVVWGVVSEDPADCKLMVNMPAGSYLNNSGGRAINDDDAYNVYTIPSDFVGTGFLIAAVTVSRAVSTITIENTADLRGFFPTTGAGGGAVGGNEFADNVFRIQDNGDTTKEIAFEASNIATGTTRTITLADNDVNLTTGLLLTNGGTGLTSIAARTVWVANSANTLVALTPGAGQSIRINAGNTAWEAFTPGAAGGISWVEVTGTSQAAAVDSAYIANNAGLVTITIPDTAAVGDILRVVGKGAGGWQIAQNAAESIHFGNAVTTTGVGGSLASVNQYDSVELVCTVANTTWTVISSQGNITVV